MANKDVKLYLGGQALLEGVMMQGPKGVVIAVRKADGTIVVENVDKKRLPKLPPIVRGVVTFAQSLIVGTKCLLRSAELSMLEGELELGAKKQKNAQSEALQNAPNTQADINKDEQSTQGEYSVQGETLQSESGETLQSTQGETLQSTQGETPQNGAAASNAQVQQNANATINAAANAQQSAPNAQSEINQGEQGAQSTKSDKKPGGKKQNEFIFGVAAVLGGSLAIMLFTVLPTLITGAVSSFFAMSNSFKTVLEGVLKLSIFLCYIWAVSGLKDIRRFFAYHGAEHKTIACFEAGDELTVENVKKYSRFNPRCGTSFMLIILVVSIALFAFLPWGNAFVRALLKLLCLPFVVGVAYEVLRIMGRGKGSALKILSAPGLWLQHFTTKEPDDSMIEVAIASVLPVIEAEGEGR